MSSWRTPVVTICLILLGIVAPSSIVAIWTQDEMTNTDRYLAMVTPLAQDPKLQAAVADRITQEITARIDTGLSRPISDAVEGWIGTQVRRVVASRAFATAWTQANRTAHDQVVALLTGRHDVATLHGDAVTVDLGSVIDLVRDRLVAAGYGLAANIPSVHVQFAVVQSADLARAQTIFRVLAALARILPVAGVALLAVALALARQRRRTVVVAGLVVAASMVLLGVALNVLRGIYLDKVASQQVTTATAEAFYDAVVAFIRSNLRAVLIVALVVSALAWLTGSPARAVRRSTGRLLGLGAADRGVSSGPVGAFAHRWIVAIRVSVVGVAGVVYVLASHPSLGWTTVLVLVTLAVLAAAEVLARTAPAGA